MEKKRICCFTGHRDIYPPDAPGLPDKLRKTVRALAADGITVFRSGGAVGFDIMAALTVLELRDELGIELEMVLPCRDQTLRWGERDKRFYRYILERCDSYGYVSEKYTKNCMLERDEKMVEGCEVCVAYCNKPTGGTAYTVNCAKRAGIKVINLAG